MCQYGMHSMQDGRPLKNPLSLMTNSFDFAELMRVKCKEETHNHRALQGPDTAWSATCLTAFANGQLWPANRISSQGIFLNYPPESKPALPLLPGSGNSSVVMAASLFRPVLGSIPGSNTELDRRSVNPSLQSGNGEPGSE